MSETKSLRIVKSLKACLCAPVFLAAVSVSAHAQTLIDSLILKQREEMIEEANKKGAKGIPNATAAPVQLQAPQTGGTNGFGQLPSLPQVGMPVPPGAAPNTPPPPPPIKKAVFDIANSRFVAVYGIKDDLTAEISYNGAIATVKKDGHVIDGWFLKHVDASIAVLKKNDENGKELTQVLKYNLGDPVIKTVEVPRKSVAKTGKKGAHKHVAPTADKPEKNDRTDLSQNTTTLADMSKRDKIAAPSSNASAPTAR